MSVVQKLLARVGIGAAQVNTLLRSAQVVPGGVLEGTVEVRGGQVTQEIGEIYLYLATKYKREQDDHTYYEECRLLRHQVSTGFTLMAGEDLAVEFAVPVPVATPLTLGTQEVYVRTGLDVSLAVNPRDWDPLRVVANPLQRLVLDGLASLGFHLHKAECEYASHRGQPYPFVQELEFRPSGTYRQRFDELEVVFRGQGDRLEVLMEIDRRGRGLAGLLAEAMDLDEHYRSLTLTPGDLKRSPQEIAQRLATFLN